MAKLNIPRISIHTHEGAKAKYINAEQQLQRSVMSCMLWEKEFYEDGETIANRIASLIPNVEPSFASDIAIEARNKMHLRHVPLLIVREMARLEFHKYLVADTLNQVIQRADELAEFVAIYWKDEKQPLSAQVKKGLAKAFNKFDAYQLAKYNRDGAVKLRDVLFLCHAKPKNKEQEEVWKKLIDNTLEPPDTWEVALSSGGDKKAHWERLLSENKLGGLALLRNLRNFYQSKVNENLVISSLEKMKTSRILPFRFISAAKHAVQWEEYIEKVMLRCLSKSDKLYGHTVLLIDVSGSMNNLVSSKSNITRLDAACGVAMLIREICEKVDIFTFSERFVRIPSRRGFALRDAITTSQKHGGTILGLSTTAIYNHRPVSRIVKFGWHGSKEFTFQGQGLNPDRLIVITDEQSHDPVPDPQGVAYMVNVASNQNGVGYGPWHRVDGWSEAVVDYIREYEVSTIRE